jgi:adenosine kinase
MKNKALIVGSIAFDIIFSVHGDMRNEVKVTEGQLDKINMMFTADGKKSYFGGTAGNISYGLSQLKTDHIVFSVAGKDFNLEYESHLSTSFADLRLKTIDDKYSATFYGISDKHYQQIGIWQPDAYSQIDNSSLLETLTNSDFADINLAIFSPGTGISTRKHMGEFRQKANRDAIVIFDPSQVLSIFYTKELLEECLSYSDILIGNEVEIKQFETLFDLKLNDIHSLGVKTIIETRAESGSIIHSHNKQIVVPALKPRKLVETTGAGDAYRAGLINGLVQGNDLLRACTIGSKVGAASVEEFGGQMYTI